MKMIPWGCETAVAPTFPPLLSVLDVIRTFGKKVMEVFRVPTNIEKISYSMNSMIYAFPSYLVKHKLAFVPPNPKLLDSTTSTFRCCATSGT